MRDDLLLTVRGIDIQLKADNSMLVAFQENEMSLRSIIPELRIKQSSNLKSFFYSIELKEANKNNLRIEDMSLTYEYTSSSFTIKSFAYTILTNIIAQLLLQQKKLFIHSSVIDKNGDGFALFGRGKTSSVIAIGKNDGLKIIAEDNAILDMTNFDVTGDLVSFNVYSDGNKNRVKGDGLLIEKGTQTSLKLIFQLSNYYNSERVTALTGFEKSSVICSFVNERLFNHSRWNSNLNMVPDFRIIDNLELQRDKIVRELTNKVEVIRLESPIKNYPKHIKEYLGI